MDEFLPPVIRDSYWFMYPVFFILYKGRDIKRKMHFKTLAYSLPEHDMNALYKEVDIISRKRKTDLTESNIKYVLNMHWRWPNYSGCRMWERIFIEQNKTGLSKFRPEGLDLNNQLEYAGITFHPSGSLTSLPFADNAFDIVICTHTIEHIIPLDKAIGELSGYTKETDCCYSLSTLFYYTLDGHVNFFYKKEELIHHFSFNKFECIKLDGDWIYAGEKS